jgi:hypothetical protein
MLISSMLNRQVMRLKGGELSVHADVGHLVVNRINDMVVSPSGHAFGFDPFAGGRQHRPRRPRGQRVDRRRDVRRALYRLRHRRRRLAVERARVGPRRPDGLVGHVREHARDRRLRLGRRCDEQPRGARRRGGRGRRSSARCERKAANEAVLYTYSVDVPSAFA